MTDDLLRCSFCSKSQKRVKKLIAGPGVYICDEDVERAERAHRQAEPHETCSFCGKSEVEWVHVPPHEWTFARTRLAICNACIKLCREVIDEGGVVGEALATRDAMVTVASSEPVTGARCPSCRAVLAESARTQLLDVKPDGDHESARVMFLYCSTCGTAIDNIMLPSD